MKRQIVRYSFGFLLGGLVLVRGLGAMTSSIDDFALSPRVTQLKFVESFFVAAGPATDPPVKTLISSYTYAWGYKPKVPMDFSIDPEKALTGAAAWFGKSESLYGYGQYDLVSPVLQKVPKDFREGQAERINSLQLKLALREVGKFPARSASPVVDPNLALNWVLTTIKAEKTKDAISQLKEFVDNDSYSSLARDRANIWLALQHQQAGNKSEAVSALSEIDGDTPLSADALLAYLRINGAASPGTVSAILNQIESRGVPESPVVWEIREHLIRALQDKDAMSQSAEIVVNTLTAMDHLLVQLDRHMATVEKKHDDDLIEWLPYGYRERAITLRQRRDYLLNVVTALKGWQPYIGAYYARLRQDPIAFSEEIRDELAKANPETRGNTPSHLLGYGLTSLLGAPPEQDSIFRLFLGLSRWEFGYDYPDNWRPPIAGFSEQTEDMSRTERRAKRKKQEEDEKLVEGAVEHINTLNGTVNSKLKGMPRYIFFGMATKAKWISERSAKHIRKIQSLIPALNEGLRNELAEGLKERRRITQVWRDNFAFLAYATYSAKDADKPLHFGFSKGITPTSGESIVRSIEQVVESEKEQAASAAVWAALKVYSDAQARETRAQALRAAALRIISQYESQSIPSAEKAVDFLKDLLDNYADLIPVDDVTYELARAQDLTQQLEPSLETLKLFVSKFPDDERVPEVLFRIAEIQYGLSEYTRAKPAYEAVLGKGKTRFADQAEYMLAWTLFKLGKYDEVPPRFIAVIDRVIKASSAADLEADKYRQNLLKDAYRSVALAFSYLGGSSDIEKFFDRYGQRPFAAEIYYYLAKHYLNYDRINDASNAYAYLVRHFPNHYHAPSLLADVIKGAREEQLLKLSLDLQEQFARTYAISGSYWGQASKSVRAEINEHMKPFLAELGQMYHADGQKQKDARSMARAADYYEQYVNTFPEDPKTPHLNFLLAEARYEQGDYARATVEYDKVAYKYGTHGEAVEAGYGALVSGQKLARQTSQPQQRKDVLKALVASSERFVKAFAGDARVDAVLATAGEDMLLLGGGAADVVRIGELLLTRTPEASIQRRAKIMLAHGYFDTGVYDKAELAFQEVLDFGGHSSTTKHELRERYGLSIYRQAEALRTAGNIPLAIETFRRVMEDAPDSTSVPNAKFDAAVLLIAGKRMTDGIKELERFVEEYPTHRLVSEIPVKLAYAYEGNGQFLKAADTFESLSTTEKDDALARQMLWRSAELREKGRQPKLAVATYEQYLKRYPAPLEKATEVRQMLADIAQKSGDIATRDRWMNEIVATVGKGVGASDRVRFLVASAAVVLGDVQAEVFGVVKLAMPLDKTLSAKQRAMERALKWYEDAGRYGIAEVTTAATFKTAELYRKLAKDLMASERPSGLSALELEQYTILLEEQSFPFEEKATDLHEVNYERIASGVYDQWVKRTMESLRVLLPFRYDRVEPAELYFEKAEVPVPKTVGAADAKSPGGAKNAQLVR